MDNYIDLLAELPLFSNINKADIQDVLKQLNAYTKNFFKNEYVKWQDNLELKREKMNNAQLALEAIKTRNIDLSQLLKNKQQEVN